MNTKESTSAGKKPYTPPVVTEFGDIKTITRNASTKVGSTDNAGKGGEDKTD